MIVVFGSINLDIVTRVARLPAAGETALGESYALHPGGKGANQALAARLAGAEVALAGAVGRDGFAEVALSRLAAAGVDLARVVRVDAPTGIATIAVDARGENLIVVASGANGRAAAELLDGLALGASDTLLLQLELPVAEAEAAALKARACGARVVLNAAPWRDPPDALLGALDLLVMNESEAAAFAAGRGRSLKAALAEFARPAVITLGAEGALLAAGGRETRIPGRKVAAIDTTAAGDAFVGVLAAGLDRGLALEAAVRRANVAASIACTREGAQPAMPRRDEIDRALDEDRTPAGRPA